MNKVVFFRPGAALIGLAFVLLAAPASAVYQCGDTTDDCICGADNPFPCCDNGGNCTWYAWHAACCNWGVVVPMLGNANTWAGVAASDPDYEVLDHPVVNSIACRASGEYGHVAWVKAVNGATITVDEMNCWGNYGVREYTYNASYFDGGYIVLAGSQCDCTSGDEEQRNCGDCGSQTRTCGSDCKWGGWGDCQGPDPGGDCDTGELGACTTGELRCVDGNHACDQTTSPSAEVCDGVDNDCNGTVDDGDVCGGGDAGGAGGTGGTGGSSGADAGPSGGTGGGPEWPSIDASTLDGSMEGGSSTSGADSYDSEEADGCACGVPGNHAPGARPWWLLMLTIPLLRRRLGR